MKKTRSPKPAKRQSSATRLSAEQLSSIHKMRTLLLEMGDKIDAFHWTRKQAIEILDIIAVGISPLTDMDIPTKDDTFRLIGKHITTTVLEGLADALRDIKQGNVDSRFRPPKALGGAAHKISETKQRKSYLDYVDIYRRHKGSSYPVAEKAIAAMLAKRGVKFRDKAVTPKMLANWRRTYSRIGGLSK